MASSAYFVAWQMTQNFDLLNRVAASAQQEFGDTDSTFDPEAWARERRWQWSTQADWISAVSAAQETGIEAWGSSAGVITDYMILSYVQSTQAQTLPE